MLLELTQFVSHTDSIFRLKYMVALFLSRISALDYKIASDWLNFKNDPVIESRCDVRRDPPVKTRINPTQVRKSEDNNLSGQNILYRRNPLLKGKTTSRTICVRAGFVVIIGLAGNKSHRIYYSCFSQEIS